MGNHLLTVHGHRVTCDDDMAFHGVKHIAYEMSQDEAQELFEQVEAAKEVAFEDKDHRKFKIIDGENGAFVVVATNVSHGWF